MFLYLWFGWESPGLGGSRCATGPPLQDPPRPGAPRRAAQHLSSLLVLQILQGPQPAAGRELAGQQRHPQGEASAEEGAQAEDHAHERRRDRARPAEQGPSGAVAQGEGGPGLAGTHACSPWGSRALLVLVPWLFLKEMTQQGQRISGPSDSQGACVLGSSSQAKRKGTALCC